MSTATSSIEWTDRTWNPTRGCGVISPGCVNCYAMKQAHRFSGAGKPFEGLTKRTKAGPQWTGVVRTVDAALLEPLSWRKPQRVFVNSMSDLFHEDVPDVFIDRVFAVMGNAERHTFQILTKRADRMLAYMRRVDALEIELSTKIRPWPLPNVWLGVSVEDQPRADERIPLLLQTPAAVRFISAEPLLGPIQIGRYLPTMAWFHSPQAMDAPLSWVIVGGESGPGARPFNVQWARDLVAQCQNAHVPVFVKQLGADAKTGVGGRFEFRDRKGGDMDEWPADLRVREFPAVRS